MTLASKSLSVLQREFILFFVNILTAVVVANKLGPHVYGIWVILNLILSYADAFVRTKVDNAAVFYLGRGLHQIGDIVYALHGIALLTSGLFCAIYLVGFDIFNDFIFGNSSFDVSFYVILILSIVPISFINMNYQYLHISREDATSLNAMILTRVFVSAVALLVFLLIFDLGLIGVVFATLAGFLASVATGAMRFRHERRTGPRFNAPVIRDLVSYGFRLYLGVAVSHLNSYSAQTIVVAFCSPAQVAFFAIAQQFSQFLLKITDSMGVFLFPRFAREASAADATAVAARAFRIACVILLPSAMAAAIMIRPALLALYGTAYLPVLLPFYILLPGVVASAIAGTLLIYFQGVGRADIVAKAAIVPLAIQVLAALVLVPSIQTVGAAIALSGSLCATALVHIAIFVRMNGIAYLRELIVRPEDIRVVAVFARTTLSAQLRFFQR